MTRTLLLTALLLAPLAPLRATNAPTKKPNIIFILADDLGIGDVSCYGADNFQTPHIDKLADTGTNKAALKKRKDAKRIEINAK
jgi:arylsulfatase A